MKILILVLVGVPATGKTTFARNLIKSNLSRNYTFAHICYDELLPNRMLLDTTAPTYPSWKEDRRTLLDDVKSMIRSLIEEDSNLCSDRFKNICLDLIGTAKPVVFVIDDNMYYRSMRYSYYQVARGFAISFCQLYFNSTVDAALSKNSCRDGESYVPEHIIINMHSSLEPPTSMNKWESCNIVIPEFVTFSDVCDKVENILQLSLLHPECSPETDGPEYCHSANIIHIVDLALRKLISRRIVEAKTILSGNELKLLGKRLTDQKARILLDLKAGIITIPQELCDDPKDEDAATFVDGLFN